MAIVGKGAVCSAIQTLRSVRVATAERAQVLKQESATIWFTGLSGSGKSSLAFDLESQLIRRDHACYVLDGDNVRHGLSHDLSFTPADRTENIRRIAEVARLFNDAGLIVITALISPYAKDRDAARQIIGAQRFLEIYLTADLATCEERDPKGLYLKARRGQIVDFTGISAPYEAPESPVLAVDTANRTIDACVQELLVLLSPYLKKERRG